MRTVVALARCSHFGPTAAVTTFTTLLALGAGMPGRRAAVVAAAALAGQLSVGWSNDWLDRHRDRAAGRNDKPLVRGDIADVTVIRGAVIAVIACAALTFLLGWRPTIGHLTAVGLAWGYNAGLKSSPISVLPYMGAFGLLPVVVTLALQPPQWPHAWAVLAGAALGGGAHFANTLPDLETDAATGVRGLPHRLGAGASLIAAALLCSAGIASVFLGVPDLSATATVLLGITVLVVLAIPVSWLLGRRAAAFRLAIAAAGGVVVSLLAGGSQLV
jgi:4-hydroxybenzoate polyprenyltransferase